VRTVLLGLALCAACLAEPAPGVEVVVPSSAAHLQDWLHPKIRDNPRPDFRGKPAASLAEFVEPVDQYAGLPGDVRRYLTAMLTVAAQYFGPSLVLWEARANPPTTGAGLAWTSTSTITFESGRTGRLAVATIFPVKSVVLPFVSNVRTPSCAGPDRVPFDSLYVSYIDPDGYSWYFAVPLQRKK